MGHESAGEITPLLQGWRGGDRKALDALLPVDSKERQRLAHFQLCKKRPDHPFQSAALRALLYGDHGWARLEQRLGPGCTGK